MASPTEQDRARVRVVAQTVLRFRRRAAEGHIRNLLGRQHPADVARVLLELPRAVRPEILLLSGDVEVMADVLSELDPAEAGRVVSSVGDEDQVIAIIEAMSQDDAAAMLREFDDEDRARILSRMAAEESEGVEDVLQHSPETAGALMTPEVFELHEDCTVEDAVRALREARDAQEAETVFYLYVVNDLDQLVGVLSLRELVVSDPSARLGKIMEREIITVRSDMDQEEAARLVEHYNFIAIPVVDDQRHLLGIITVDDVLDVLREEATEDLLRMSGAWGVPQRGTPVLARMPGRLAWLLASGLTAFVVTWLVRAVISAPSLDYWLVLLPMLLLLSLTAAMHAAAVAVGAVTTAQLPAERVWPYLMREAGAGLLMAVLAGLFCAGVGWLMLNGAALVSLGAAVGTGVAVAALLGSAVPLLLHRLHVDPTQAPGMLVLSLSAIASAGGGLLVADLLR